MRKVLIAILAILFLGCGDSSDEGMTVRPRWVESRDRGKRHCYFVDYQMLQRVATHGQFSGICGLGRDSKTLTGYGYRAVIGCGRDFDLAVDHRR